MKCDAKNKLSKIIKLFIILSVLVISGIGIKLIASIYISKHNQQINIKQQVIPIFVEALGILEPEGKVNVSTSSHLGTSRIAKVFVEESDLVKNGQIIGILDTYDRFLATREIAKALVRQKVSELEKAEADQKFVLQRQKNKILFVKSKLVRIENELGNASKDLESYHSEFKDETVYHPSHNSILENIKTLEEKLILTKREMNDLQKGNKKLLDDFSIELKIIKAQIKQAIYDVKIAQIDLILTETRAPISGKILKIFSKPGEVINIENGLLEMGNTDQMYAIAYIYETDIGKVRIGQKATISSEVFEGEITGKVESIGLNIIETVNVVEVKICLSKSNKVSRLTNLQVNVKIWV